MKFLLVIFLLTLLVPNVVSAQGGDIMLALLWVYVMPPFIVLLISSIILSLIKYKSHKFLLLVDVILAFIYSLIYVYFTFDPFHKSSINISRALFAGIVPFFTAYGLFLIIIIGIVVVCAKIFGKKIEHIGKIFTHCIVIGYLFIVFGNFYTYSATYLLYSSDCNNNVLILKTSSKEISFDTCVWTNAKERLNPTLCDRLNFPEEVDRCKYWANAEMVKSGDLSACSKLQGSYPDPETHDKCSK